MNSPKDKRERKVGMERKYHLLSSPIKIGSVELSTRIAMAPVDTQYCTPEGYVTPKMIDFYRRRAAGGVSLIVTGNTGVDLGGKSNVRMAGLFDDSYIEGARKLVSAVKREGSKIFIQLNHAGRQSKPEYLGGRKPVAPSPIPCPLLRVMPRELNGEEIEMLTERFAEAAYRAWQSGADGVEIHMAHGYLLCSFLSPFSNRRTDQYGGSIEGRLRFPLAVLKSIRQKLPSSFVLGCRISASEEIEGGLTLKETVLIAQAFERAGIDYIHVSACNNASAHKNIPSYYEPPGVFSGYASTIKKAVSIPVIAIGRIHSLEVAEEILRTQKADLVATARAFIADPDFAAPLKDEKKLSILQNWKGPNCISCCRCIAGLVKGKDGLLCTVNPLLGKDEFKKSIQRCEIKKNILVVGGGPAGMLAAFRAAKRGHRVTLWERKAHLGGALYYAGLAAHKGPFRDYLNYLIKCLNDSPVEVVVEQFGDLDSIKEFRPDEVILAMGASKPTPSIPGIERVDWESVSEGFDNPCTRGTRVLVAGGGGRGAELAEFLALSGGKVTLVEVGKRIASDIPLQVRHYLAQRLGAVGVKVLLNTELKKVAPEGVWVKGPEGEKELRGFDRIFLALGESTNDELYRELLNENIAAQLIGDAVAPRDLMAAVCDGARVGDSV